MPKEVEVRNRVSVTDGEVRAFYENNPEVFRVPAEFTVREIALLADESDPDARAAQRARAEEARTRLMQPDADLDAIVHGHQIHRDASPLGMAEGPETFGVLRDWAFEASTLARDVFYLGNCDARDTLTYRLFSVEPAGTNRIKLASCLYRNSDGAKVATILTLKSLTR